MSRHFKTTAIIETALEVLTEHRPMTVRQVYYQLVSRQVTKNNRSAYQAVGKALVAARQEGLIPWNWIEDRLRRPRSVPMWKGLAEFGEDAAASYRRNVWATQPHYIECWLEKDALSGIFEEALAPFGVTLNVGRGFDGWSSIQQAARRLGGGDNATVLYFGDFDPSGEDILRSLSERLAHFDCRPEILKVALNRADIDTCGLPPDLTKATDSRSRKFVARHGDATAELDALPIDVLERRICTEISARMDLSALDDVHDQEEVDRASLAAALGGMS